MDFGNTFFIITTILGGFLFILLLSLLFISRHSQRVMQSMVDIITEPDRARIQDASNILQSIMADEIKKILGGFQTIQNTLRSQIAVAEELRKELDTRNETLVGMANDAIQRVAQMSGRMDNTVSGLREVVNSENWNDVSNATDKFAGTIQETLSRISETTKVSTDKINQINECIAQWDTESDKFTTNLQKSLDAGKEQFLAMTDNANTAQETISKLTETTVEDFSKIRNAASEYKDSLESNDKITSAYLAKLDTFSKQSKKQLDAQLNALTNTANVVGAQVLLSESSVEKQVRKLTDAVETLITSATETESAVRGISTELSGLTNHFENEIKDFATDVVSELKTVSGVADATLQDTKVAANAFSESVKSMATGVRETLIEMNTAHTQLSGQSEGLIKMSAETTAQLKPLSELIERYYIALPDLATASENMGTSLAKTVSDLDEKIDAIRNTVAESTVAVSESATKLEELAGQSRQQMIDLMSDYAKAVDTMQTLNKQMMVARAAAPMEAIKTTPNTAPRASSRDFVEQSGATFDKMYEQTIDLTRAMGGEIPDVVWKKYHDGDKTIFAKWMAKMLKVTNKKQIRELLKTDAVFRSQATQFVHSFDKILTAAHQTDTGEKLTAAMLKNDLGIIYSALASQV